MINTFVNEINFLQTRHTHTQIRHTCKLTPIKNSRLCKLGKCMELEEMVSYWVWFDEDGSVHSMNERTQRISK